MLDPLMKTLQDNDIQYDILEYKDIELSEQARLCVGRALIGSAEQLHMDEKELVNKASKNTTILYYPDFKTLTLWFIIDGHEIYVDIPNDHWKLKVNSVH